VLQQMRAKALWIWGILFVAFVGGFLFVDTSGLIGRGPVTTSTVVATVEGQDILYMDWLNASSQMAQQQEQQRGRGLSMDERRQLDDQTFNEMVSDILLRREYKRRGIRVTDAEIVEMARYSPPPQFQNMPELQTDGRFDAAKYQRFLASPAARQQGILAGLESYYRSEIPRQKLFAQVAGDVYVSDTRLWNIWRDTHDSATVSYVVFRPAPTKDDIAAVTDADVRAWYDAHRSEFERPGRAVLSIVSISRVPSAADTLATLERIRAIRDEIAKGASIEDVARRESDDSSSATRGGDLGKATRGIYVKQFNDAVFSLPVGTISQPIKTEYGYHVVRVDKRVADSVWAHHVLKLVRQGDSSATRTDRMADSLAKAAAGATAPAVFDDAAKAMNLLVSRIIANEGEVASYLGRSVPGATAWAFGGTQPGETSDLFDDDAAYYLARLDSLRHGGVQPLESVRDEIRTILARRKAIEGSLPRAAELARAAAAGSLEAAARAIGRPVEKEGPFTRSTPVAAFGFISEVSGAAFGIQAGRVSEPVRTDDGVFVLRVDRRATADSAAWSAQRMTQRLQVQNSLREQKVRTYMESLRKAAKIDDRRVEINALQRRQAVTN
jgi:parvulin-like peptidyl-prolyl isomerase